MTLLVDCHLHTSGASLSDSSDTRDSAESGAPPRDIKLRFSAFVLGAFSFVRLSHLFVRICSALSFSVPHALPYIAPTPCHFGLLFCALIFRLVVLLPLLNAEDIHAAPDDGDDDAMELLDNTMNSSWLFGPFSPLIVLTLAFGTVLGVAAKYSTTAVDFVVGYAPQYQVSHSVAF